MTDELRTNVNITGQESASGPLQQVAQAGITASGSLQQLDAVLAQVRAATAATAQAQGQLQQSLRATAQAAAQAAQQTQQANQQINNAGNAGGGAGGGFAQQMQRGLQSLQGEAQKTGSVFQNIGSALQSPFRLLGSAAQGVQGTIRGFGDAMTSAMGPILQGAGFALAIAGINGLGGAIQGVMATAIGFNSQLQLAEISLTSFTGSATIAHQEIQALQVLAANSPFEFQDVLVGARRFQSLGLSAGQTFTLLKDLSAIGASFGLDNNQMARSELAIQQVGVKGRLTGEELRQMGNDGFQAMRIIQQVTGQSMGSIQKDIEAGTFSASKFFGILHEYSQRPEIATLAEKINQSFQVQASNVHDILQQLISTGTQPFFQSVTAGMGGLATALQSDGFRQFAADFGASTQQVLGALGPVETKLKSAFDVFQTGDMGRAAQMALGAVGDAFNILGQQMFGAGENVAATFAQGILSGAGSAIQQAAEFAAQIVANFLVGQSPPPQGPLSSVDAGGLAVAQAWMQGFEGADFAGVAEGRAAAVRDALGKVTGTLTIDQSRQALAAAGSDMDRLRAITEAATGASRTLSDSMREIQSETQQLGRDADQVKTSYDAQITPLERSLQALRDQGNEESKLYDLEKRRRDMTLSAAERAAQGDPVKRAELQNQDQALQATEKQLRLEEQRIRLQSAGATGKSADQAKAEEAKIAQQINEIEFKRATIQNQMDGLVDREALARINVQKAQASQADAAHDLTKAQDDYNKSIQENDLEKQIHTLQNAEKDTLAPIEERKKLLEAERQQLQEQSQAYAQIKADAGEVLTIARTAEAERKAAAVQAKKDAKEHGGDAPLGAGLPEADIAGVAAQAGEKVGTSFLNSVQGKLAELGPRIGAAVTGAVIGGAVFGPIGVIAGGMFGDSFMTALQAKVPNVGVIASDSLKTFQQALQGNWAPPGVDEWVNPFVEKVGNAGKAIHEFATTFGQEWRDIDAGGAISGMFATIGKTLGDVTTAMTGAGTASGTASPQMSTAASAGKGLADNIKLAADTIKGFVEVAGPPMVGVITWIKDTGFPGATTAAQQVKGALDAFDGSLRTVITEAEKQGIFTNLAATFDAVRAAASLLAGFFTNTVQPSIQGVNTDGDLQKGMLEGLLKPYADITQGAKDFATGVGLVSSAMGTLVQQEGGLLKFFEHIGGPLGSLATVLKGTVAIDFSKVGAFLGQNQSGSAPSSGALVDRARTAAIGHGIDPEIFVRQIQQESSFNPNVPTHGSDAGPIRGIAQMSPDIANRAATMLGVTTEEFWNSVELQLEGAAAIMQSYLSKYGSYANALVAYNAGEGRVGGTLPNETQDYLRIILQGQQRGPGAQVQGPVGTGGFLPIRNDVSQFAAGMSWEEAATRCGPHAAQLFAQAIGRFPTAPEADELARAFGWVPGQGMTSAAAWPDMAQALINQTGGGAKIQQITGAQAPAAIATGAPVAINTADHYFVAQGYNPQTQQFNVGQTGSVMSKQGGAEWMTLADMDRVGRGIISVFTEVRTASDATTASTTTLGQASRAAAGQIQSAAPPAQVFATALDALYNSVANGNTPLNTLQMQLVEIAAKAGDQGAAGELQALVTGTETSAQALENLATMAGTANPEIARLVTGYRALGGAAQATEKQNADFALSLLNVYKQAETVKTEIGSAVSDAAKSVVGAVGTAGRAGAPGIPNPQQAAAPLVAVNTQVDQANQSVPQLAENWGKAQQAVQSYAQIDLQDQRVQQQISVVDNLANAWDSARGKVEDYIKKLDDAIQKQQDSGIQFPHGGVMPYTGMALVHAGERVLQAGPTGWNMERGGDTINLTINGAGGGAARLRRNAAELLYMLEQRRADSRRAAFGQL